MLYQKEPKYLCALCKYEHILNIMGLHYKANKFMVINIVELGKYCQDEFKTSLEGKKEDEYVGTLFIAIDKDNKVFHSRSPHILSKGC